MTSERGLRLWVALLVLACASLLLAAIVLALLPDAEVPVRGDDFDAALGEASAQAERADQEASGLSVSLALGVALGAPIGLSVAGIITYRRYRSQVAEGR